MTTPVADPNPTKNYKPDDDDKALQIVAYMFAGLAMMLNIRLSYSAAPYALLRFKLPENLFSVFVRRIASALELWCLPSMAIGNIVDTAMKLCTTEKATYTWADNQNKLTGTDDEDKLINNKRIKFHAIIVPSMVTMWCDFITYYILTVKLKQPISTPVAAAAVVQPLVPHTVVSKILMPKVVRPRNSGTFCLLISMIPMTNLIGK